MGRTAGKRKTRSPALKWTLVGRVKRDRAEIVKVPIDPGAPDAPKEEVIQVLRGPILRGRLGHRGLLSDRTGQAALEAFRLAVHEAKKQ